MSQSFDVMIVGGGLAGTALALALQRSHLKVALIQAAQAMPTTESWDSRIYAVTPGNADFLRRLGVWDVLDQERIAPIHGMHIWGDDAMPATAPMLVFDAYTAGQSTLGFIAEERLLHAGLWQALDDVDVDVYAPASCQALQCLADQAMLTLADGQQLTAKLVVGADGGNSWVRGQAGIAVSSTPYQQQGVVANFTTEQQHRNIARQWFRRDGVLAWLPLPGQRMSMVWSAFDASAENLMQLSAETLCRTVAEAGGYALGELQLLTPPVAFPLVMQRNQSVVAPRLALVGDAAHRVHPLAGQGINLGWRDVQTLAALLTEPTPDVGRWDRLRRYERARQADVLAMQGVTYGLQKLFNNGSPVLGWLRNNGLHVVNRIAPIKRLLMTQAMN